MNLKAFMLFERDQANTLRKRLAERPDRIIIVSGPRQVGKTTLVQTVLQGLDQQVQQSRFLRADEPHAETTIWANDSAVSARAGGTRKDEEWLVWNWHEARKIAQRNAGFILAIDEIQKIPNWSATIKGLWDSDRSNNIQLHVVLLGSSPLLVQKGLSESLAGRYELLRCGHWSYQEMQSAFDVNLEQYIYFGGYPGAAQYIADEPRWRNYVSDSLVAPSIDQDIYQLTRVDKPALLKHLYRLSCNYSGQILAYSKMAPQLGDGKSNETTLAHYLNLLAQAGLVAGISKYAGQQLRRRNSPPKINVMNTAMMAVEGGYSFNEARQDRSYWGRLFESCAGAHLLNTSAGKCDIYYWRESPVEVDFVISKGTRLVAVEIKSGKSKGVNTGLDAFQNHFPQAKKLIVGAEGISMPEFLSYPADHWF